MKCTAKRFAHLVGRSYILRFAILLVPLSIQNSAHGLESGLIYLRGIIGFNLQQPSFTVSQAFLRQPGILSPTSSIHSQSGDAQVTDYTPQIVGLSSENRNLGAAKGFCAGFEIGYHVSPYFRVGANLNYSITKSLNNSYVPVNLEAPGLGLTTFFRFKDKPGSIGKRIMTAYKYIPNPENGTPGNDTIYSFAYDGNYNENGEPVTIGEKGNSALLDMTPAIGRATFNTFSALCNFYVEFVEDGEIMPYFLIGVGAGVTQGKDVGRDNPMQTPNMPEILGDRLVSSISSFATFLAQAGIGVGFQLTPSLIIDFTYTIGNQAQGKYRADVISLGTVKSYEGSSTVNARNHSYGDDMISDIAADTTTTRTNPLNQSITITRKQNMSIQQSIFASLRFQF